jgi:hypothetical protein
MRGSMEKGGAWLIYLELSAGVWVVDLSDFTQFYHV